MSKISPLNRHLLAKFLVQPWSQKLLLLEGFLTLIGTMLLVRWVPFRWWSRYLGTQTIATPLIRVPYQNEMMHDVRRTIRRINRLFGGRFTCLMQAVAGKVMLNRRGISNTLVLGIYTKHNSKQELVIEAHAWLQTNSIILLGGEVYKHFTPITQFYSS